MCFVFFAGDGPDLADATVKAGADLRALCAAVGIRCSTRAAAGDAFYDSTVVDRGMLKLVEIVIVALAVLVHRKEIEQQTEWVKEVLTVAPKESFDKESWRSPDKWPLYDGGIRLN